MDLVIALEMSRLQLIEDEVRKQHREQSGTSSIDIRSASIDDHSEEAQLRLAIHLSLEESRKKDDKALASPKTGGQPFEAVPSTSWGTTILFHSKSKNYKYVFPFFSMYSSQR